MTNPTELLDSFKHELLNQGTWYWVDKNGTRARMLTAMQKMLKAGMADEVVKDIIIDLQIAGYVEHEKQVKAKTGLSVREFMLKKLTDLGPLAPEPQAEIIIKDQEPACSILGQS